MFSDIFSVPRGAKSSQITEKRTHKADKTEPLKEQHWENEHTFLKLSRTPGSRGHLT